MRKNFMLIAGLALASMGMGNVTGTPTMNTVNKTIHENPAIQGNLFTRRQFNFRRSGSDVRPNSRMHKIMKLKYGGFKKHFNKKRHGKMLRRKHSKN